MMLVWAAASAPSPGLLLPQGGAAAWPPGDGEDQPVQGAGPEADRPAEPALHGWPAGGGQRPQPLLQMVQRERQARQVCGGDVAGVLDSGATLTLDPRPSGSASAASSSRVRGCSSGQGLAGPPKGGWLPSSKLRLDCRTANKMAHMVAWHCPADSDGGWCGFWLLGLTSRCLQPPVLQDRGDGGGARHPGVCADRRGREPHGCQVRS